MQSNGSNPTAIRSLIVNSMTNHGQLGLECILRHANGEHCQVLEGRAEDDCGSTQPVRSPSTALTTISNLFDFTSEARPLGHRSGTRS